MAGRVWPISTEKRDPAVPIAGYNGTYINARRNLRPWTCCLVYAACGAVGTMRASGYLGHFVENWTIGVEEGRTLIPLRAGAALNLSGISRPGMATPKLVQRE